MILLPQPLRHWDYKYEIIMPALNQISESKFPWHEKLNNISLELEM